MDHEKTRKLEKEIENMKSDQNRKINIATEEYQARNLLLND